MQHPNKKKLFPNSNAPLLDWRIYFHLDVFRVDGYLKEHAAIVNIDSSKMTVTAYFEDYRGNSWELTVLEIIFIVHILTVFPEYMVFSK